MFKNEKPKTKTPFAYYEGSRGILTEIEGVWTAKFTLEGHRICVPAIFFHDLMFMDNLRGND